MSDTTAGLLQVGLLIVALAVCYRPLGAHMSRVYEDEHDTRAERIVYRAMGVDPKSDQRWPAYARALLAFSAVGVLFLYALFVPTLPPPTAAIVGAHDVAWTAQAQQPLTVASDIR